MEPGDNDTASEKFVRGLHWLLAERESNVISEDVRRSISTRAAKGLTNGGTPKPGYKTEGGRLVIVKEDAATVEEIFRLACLKKTPMQIANELNARGLRTRVRISKKGNKSGGNPFTQDYVFRILRDPTYKGVIIYNGESYQGDFEPIISEDVWDAAQVALENRPSKREGITQRRDRYFMPLKGILRCGHCGAALKPTYTKKADKLYHYYICGKHEDLGKDSSCPVQRISARVVERSVLTAVGEMANQSEVIEKVLNADASGQGKRIRELRSQRRAIQKQLKEIDSDVRELKAKLLAVAGTIVGDEIRDEAQALTEKKKQLVADEVQLEQQIKFLELEHLDADKVSRGFKKFAEAVAMLSESEQKELFRLLFQKIIVSEGVTIPDPGIPSDKRCRMQRRQVTAIITLRGAAIQALAAGESQAKGRARNLAVELIIVHSRSKPTESFGILEPIYKECGSKPTGPTRKRTPKTEHEIHKAIRWKKEMESLGIGQNEFARRKGLSQGAVAHVMAWLKLEPATIGVLKKLTGTQIRRVSRSARSKLLLHYGQAQLQLLKALLGK